MSHSNISIFVAHLGCPHQCSFCNQRHITGHTSKPMASDVHDAVKVAKASKGYNKDECEIAFFGGSFTAIETDYMTELLSAAHQHILSGEVSGIRISTRPDCIDEKILTLLKHYGVTAIELGAQSMVDRVLSANNRGHSVDDVVVSSRLIKAFGFELGLQMMTGLYGSSEQDDIYTADSLINLQPDTVRIYPTITIKNTYLESLFSEGIYIPQTLDEAVTLCAKLDDMFESAGIRVIRIGLHSLEPDSYVAGPWHPSFRELCDSYRYRVKIENAIASSGQYNLFVCPSELSKVIGQKRSNIEYFKNKSISLNIISDKTVGRNDFIVEEVR